MKDRKGMSQVLSLIVAASVLMMTALLVIMFTSGSLTGFFSDIGGTSCTTTIDSKCQAGATEVEPPSSCFNDQDDPIDAAPNGIDGPDSTYTCPTEEGDSGL